MPNDLPDRSARRPAPETALPPAPQQLALLARTLGHLPAAVATLSGPEHRLTFFNAPYQALMGGRAELGRAVAEVHLGAGGQGFVAVLDRAYRTGQPVVGTELVLWREDAATDLAPPRRAALVCHPLTDGQGHVTGVLALLVEAPPPGPARPEWEAQERRTDWLNEELQAANEEIRANNDALTHAQAQLRQLNRELEARVQAQTRAVVRAQAATEAQRLLLHEVLHQAPVAIAYLDGPAYRIQVANPTVCELWGRPEAALLGRPLLDALPELHGQGVDALLDGVLHSGEPFTGTELPFRLQRRGQLETIYFNFVYHPQRNAQGRTSGVLVVATDVTAQVQARQHLEAQERRTGALNEELAVINEELTAANEEIQANNAELERTQGQLRELNDALEARVRQRTRQVAQAQAATERQRQRLERLFMQAPAAVCILDGPALVFELVNPAYQQLFPGRRLLGQPLLEALPELTDQPVWHTLRRVYETGETHLELGIRIPVAAHEGGPLQDFYFNYIQQARYDEQGRVDGVLVFAFEVSAQVLARAQVEQLNQQLAQVNQDVQARNAALATTNQQLTRTNADLDNFIYAASHDLKAPISNIEGLLRLLREELLPATGHEDEDLVPVLERMQEAVERFKRTIDHLTDVSKLQLEFDRPVVATLLAPVLEDVREDLRPLLSTTGGQLSVDVAACPTLLISEKNLRSVLYNLLSNALKYHHPDRVPQVQLSCRPEGGRHVLRVQDNGLGLAAEQQAKLFGLFQRLHTHVEGTGVGLYMVKKMVENAEGTLTVHSREGEGSTFTASFPA